MKKKLLSWLPTRRQLKKTFIYRLFGKGIFAHDLWHLTRESLAGGLSLGLFIAFSPTIPFQMIMATLGALYFRVNLPIALLACWVTNPFTAGAIYYAGWKVGRRIVFTPWIEDLIFLQPFGARFNSFLVQSTTLWAGCLVLGALVALTANLLVRLFWPKKYEDKKTSAVR